MRISERKKETLFEKSIARKSFKKYHSSQSGITHNISMLLSPLEITENIPLSVYPKLS